MKLTEVEEKEFNQERMCELCEIHILGCGHSTSTFQCEGCSCDEAEEYYIEEVVEQREEKRVERIDKLLKINNV